MTPERAKELLPIITAFANGETVQWRRDWGASPTEWRDYNVQQGPSFTSLVAWRIKPKVPEYRLFVYDNDPLQTMKGLVCAVTRNCSLSANIYQLASYNASVGRGEGRWLTDWLPIPNYKE